MRRPIHFEKCDQCKATVKMIAGVECPRCGSNKSFRGIDFPEKQYQSERFYGSRRARSADEQDEWRRDDDDRRKPLDFGD